jgi:hypothetical protein
MTRPLHASSQRIAAIDEYIAFDIGTTTGDGWVAWDEIIDGGHLDSFFDQIAAGTDGRALPRDTAAAFLGGGLVAVVVTAPVALLVREQRVPHFAPADLSIHRHSAGYFDRISFGGGRFSALATDPEATHEDADIVADLSELFRRLAHSVVACLEPVLAEIRRKAPFGLRGLWGFVADEAASAELAVAPDRDPTYAPGFVDAAAALTPHLRSRPTLYTIDRPDGTHRFSIRSVCCLWYKTPNAQDRAANGEFGYCWTCPLPNEADRRAQLETGLTT